MLHRNYCRILFLCLITGLLSCILCIGAFADVMPDVTITCRPETLIEPAEVTLSFTVSNTTDNICANLYISTSDGLVSEPLGSLGTGDSISFTRRHTVTAAELSAEKIAYTLTYDDPAKPERKINFTVETPVHKAESLTRCEFTRSFSADTIPEGGTLTILYSVHNTGNIQLEGLRIRDKLGDFTGRIETLPAGETRSLVSRVTLSAASVSEAELSYETDEGKQSLQLANIEIPLSSPELKCEFSANYRSDTTPSGEGVLILKNTGNTDFYDITVSDDFSGDIIAEGINLLSGNSHIVRREFNVRGTQDVRWRVIANSTDATITDIMTDTVTLTAPDPSDLSNVTFTMTALTPRLKRAGNAQFRLTIVNHGDADVRNLHVYEETAGNILDLLVVAANGTLTRELSLPVTESTELSFRLEYADADGWQYTEDGGTTEIRISNDGVTPDVSRSSFIDFNGRSIRIGGSSMFAILLIIGILLLIILTVILIILSHRARIRKQVEIALRKQHKGRP